MPLYEYQCDVCSHRFERIQKFSDPLVDVCPSCGGAVRKLLSSPAIQFKGSGWYITDYAKKSAGKSDDGKGAQTEKTEKTETSGNAAKSDAGAATSTGGSAASTDSGASGSKTTSSS
jgi:putative FmdB family regulatory protein